MKRLLDIVFRVIAVVALVSLLTACGGGGGVTSDRTAGGIEADRSLELGGNMQDADNPGSGAGGVSATLLDESGQIASTDTNENGDFNFGRIRFAGTLQVQFGNDPRNIPLEISSQKVELVFLDVSYSERRKEATIENVEVALSSAQQDQETIESFDTNAQNEAIENLGSQGGGQKKKDRGDGIPSGQAQSSVQQDLDEEGLF